MIWRPYQQMRNPALPYRIVDAEGVFLYTENQRLIDSISSWWCVIHGYKHPVITDEIVEQAKLFSHVMLAGLTHEPVERLSAKLEEILPGDLKHSFFSDSGSVAVEVALKIALQYHVNKGNSERIKVLSLTHAYHGDTFKTMEAGDDEEYHYILKAYGEKRFNIHIPTTISDLESAFERYGEELNCFIVEPLLQCAGGMRVYDVSFLRRARELCDQYDVLLIFDEVATGFGRTGNRFVSDLVQPDVVCLGKALTGGYVGHAA
ncbi:MAG: aminotransferase class III-fold pyridoxal phosphate-dependent enzyme, partial [Thermoguttaceae bacterium]|nr:aminotransferase class III-fold pyridoxal phosphate-dependent enzyme [Thermoguttaceae bacterium]